MRQKIVLISITIIEIIIIAFIIKWQNSGAEFYATNIYPFISTLTTATTGWIKFSLGDLFVMLFAIGLISLPFTPGIKAWNNVWYFALFTGFIYIWFYLSWGMNYFRDNIYVRTNKEVKSFSPEQLESVTSTFIDTLNTLYDNYQITTTFKESLIESYNHIAPNYSLTTVKLKSHKPMISNRLMEKVGVSGYFNPFFGEFHIRTSILEPSIPFTFAHETSHKGSVSSEDEANLIAFIACESSEDSYARFSGYYTIVRYLLNSCYGVLPKEQWAALRDKINPEILSLYKQESEHNQALYSEKLGNFQSWIYNHFLKSNNVAAGTKSYSQVVGLILNFQNSHTSTTGHIE
ncbi:MAG: DUF3810 domain-containing protein [Rikenellaceae bacterium]